MKKLSYLTIALALTIFVSCKGKSAKDAEDENMDTISTQVETGASESIENAAKVDEVLNQPSEDELFGTDVDDGAVESATKK